MQNPLAMNRKDNTNSYLVDIIFSWRLVLPWNKNEERTTFAVVGIGSTPPPPPRRGGGGDPQPRTRNTNPHKDKTKVG